MLRKMIPQSRQTASQLPLHKGAFAPFRYIKEMPALLLSRSCAGIRY